MFDLKYSLLCSAVLTSHVFIAVRPFSLEYICYLISKYVQMVIIQHIMHKMSCLGAVLLALFDDIKYAQYMDGILTEVVFIYEV